MISLHIRNIRREKRHPYTFGKENSIERTGIVVLNAFQDRDCIPNPSIARSMIEVVSGFLTFEVSTLTLSLELFSVTTDPLHEGPYVLKCQQNINTGCSY